ncbi:hypothetical protein [Streptacidiphilus sp. PAMC 29251]
MTGESTSFTIGTEDRTSDGACSELTRVVIDPFARTLIRLILAPVEPLVPVGLVDRVDGSRAGVDTQCSPGDSAASRISRNPRWAPPMESIFVSALTVGQWFPGSPT